MVFRFRIPTSPHTKGRGIYRYSSSNQIFLSRKVSCEGASKLKLTCSMELNVCYLIKYITNSYKKEKKKRRSYITNIILNEGKHSEEFHINYLLCNCKREVLILACYLQKVISFVGILRMIFFNSLLERAKKNIKYHKYHKQYSYYLC
jgi:hypothetical protein